MTQKPFSPTLLPQSGITTSTQHSTLHTTHSTTAPPFPHGIVLNDTEEQEIHKKPLRNLKFTFRTGKVVAILSVVCYNIYKNKIYENKIGE
jgi:hypothetical protein